MTETMWKVLLLLLEKMLLAWLMASIGSRHMVSGRSPVEQSNGHTVHPAREELVAARRMKPFWTSTGLCPPEPRNASGAFLVSRDSLMNLELIASLPNHGIRHVRIHWLLELLEVYHEQEQFYFNFTRLDALLDHLRRVGLYPGFELMGIPNGSHSAAGWWKPYAPDFWIDLVQQLVGRYTDRYGVQYVSKWRFETWNEPDLRTYNLLNFTVNEYLSYVYAIRDGLLTMAQRVQAVPHGNERLKANLFPLYGPAGLFKSVQHHPFCWSVIQVCGANITQGCPFDTITFHRKGSGRWASEVLDGGRQLLEDMLNSFPSVERLKFANDEADPIAGWSTGRPFQADVRYAAMLFSIVAQHWSAIAAGNELGRRFQFLSHDNAFLSYHPYVFEQRTLFARFQMNLTKPPHVQFIAKPVYSALGMLANIAPFAGPTQFLNGNISYVLSTDKNRKYVCLVASRSNDSFPMRDKRTYLNMTIPVDMVRAGDRSHTALVHRISYLVEAIQDGRNDPFRVWQLQGKPPFPTTEQLAAMRALQLPSVLHTETRMIAFGKVTKRTEIALSLRGPWIVSVRLCSEDYTLPGRVRNVRVRSVYRDEVIIHWDLAMGENRENRCIQTYEVWFKARKLYGSNETDKVQCKWCHINVSKHTPFLFYQFVSKISFPASVHAVRTGEGEKMDCKIERDDTRRESSDVPLSANVSSGRGRSTLHGDSYQLRLGLVILLRAFKVYQEDANFDFVIALEDPAGKDFDDIMYHYNSPSLSSDGTVSVQAKHKRNCKGNTSILTENMLLAPANSKNSSFSIPKYFQSFLEVEQTLKTNIHTYVLCTNAMLDESVEDRLLIKRNHVGDALQFSYDIGASCYQINPKQARKNLEHKLVDSCMLELGKLLAKDVVSGTEITFDNSLYNAFASFINDCVQTSVPGNINASSRSYRFSEAFFNASPTSPIGSLRTGFGEAYKELTNGDRMEQAILKINSTALTIVLSEGNGLDRKLALFYESFVLVCNSLNEEMLYRKAVELVPKWCNTLAVKDLHLMLFDAIKSENPVPIDLKFVQQMLRAPDINTTIAELKYSSKEYLEQLRQNYLHVELDSERLSRSALAKFLRNGDACEVYVLSKSLGSKLNSLVAAQTLSLLQNEAIFVDSTNYRETRTMNDVLHNLLSYLKDVNHPTMKLIMIVGKLNRDTIESARELGKNYNQKIIVIEETQADLERSNPGETYFVDDLARGALCQLFEAHETITMFGTVTSLSRIVSVSDELKFLADVLDHLTIGSDHSVNERNYDKIKHWYIHRKFVAFDSSIEKDKVNVAQYINRNRNAIPYSKQDDIPLAEMAKCVDRHDADTSSEVARVLDMSEEVVNPPGFQEGDNGKICIFLNDAGHGKTCFFTWLAWRLAKQDPTLYVVKLNAMEYTTDFDRLKGSGVQNPDNTDMARLLYRLVHLALFVPAVHRQSIQETDHQRGEADRCAKLLTVADGRIVLDEVKAKLLPAKQLIELRLFREKCNDQQLIVILDGFDEIAPYYETVVMSCVLRLAKFEGIRRIYLSSRPCDYKKKFKAFFSNCSMMQLEPFARGDVILSLDKFLLHRVPDYSRCEKVHRIHILTVLYTIILEALGDLTIVPLLLYMVQVTLLPVIMESINFELHTISKRMLASPKLDTMQLVEHFIDRKIEILFTDKSGTSDSAAKTAAAMDLFSFYTKEIKERHMLLAMCAIFDRNSRKQLLSTLEQNSVTELTEKVIQGTEKTGIVNGIQDGVPQFVHRLFAEYFAACWLNRNRDRFKKEGVFQSQAIWTHSLEQMRNFLDRMILKESDGCEMHWTLVNNSVEGFRKILHKMPAAITAKDSVGRLPIHLVAKRNIFAEELLAAMPAELVNANDALFGWNALDYAFLLSDGFAVRDLQKWGVRLNVDVLLQQLYSNDEDNIFYYGTNYAYYLRHFGKPSDVADSKISERVVEHLLKVRGLDIYAPRQKFDSLSVLEFSAAWNLREMFHQFVTQSGQPAQVLHGMVDRLFQLAFERKAHDIITYLVEYCSFSLPVITDNRGLLESAKRAIENNQLEWFKPLFQQLCTRYGLPHVEENDIVAEVAVDGEEEMIEFEIEDACCVHSSKNVRLSLPEFSLSDDIDGNVEEIVVEWLLARAINVGNVSIASYILQKTNRAVTNRLIVTIMRLFPKSIPLCHKKAIPAYKYLLNKTLDLHSVDEEGRNLFHMTAQNGCFFMLPCLVSKGFDPLQINAQNHWNGFHYLMSDADTYGFRAPKALAFFQRVAHVDGFNTLSKTGESVFDIAITSSFGIQAQMLVQAQYCSLSCEEKVNVVVNLIAGMLPKHGTERTLEYLFCSREHSSTYGFVADSVWHAVYNFIIDKIPIV